MRETTRACTGQARPARRPTAARDPNQEDRTTPARDPKQGHHCISLHKAVEQTCPASKRYGAFGVPHKRRARKQLYTTPGHVIFTHPSPKRHIRLKRQHHRPTTATMPMASPLPLTIVVSMEKQGIDTHTCKATPQEAAQRIIKSTFSVTS